ncbi:MAG: CBS domain-containing protein [Saprospiraceae bacterium]|uniref:CBS domain-containing protein n=1 Tax=Candidatus Opimibacter skivensis TaxID=2982028 RepID=A0A9D7SSV5_9BACT|nr:CBS domain-containing protein [Candidatus Opimibacter skivensis]
MGEQHVSIVKSHDEMQRFVKSLLDDVNALEYMIKNDWFETDIVRIGAEQEMVLVDQTTFKPACVNMEALEHMTEWDWVGTELARFNLETNLDPREFSGSALRDMEDENSAKLALIEGIVNKFGATIILTGILPTLRKFDMEMSNLTPKQRYFALMEAINQQMMGNTYELNLVGIDELLLKHDSPLLEAVNTSFQVHLQVSPADFVPMYNLAQALSAPVMALAANSPIVFGRRLWHESRIAMFQQALDTRSTQEHMRERSARVNFGKQWLDHSILDIYREDIARFRVLLSGDVRENAREMILAGKTPKLGSLQVHNSTVYRWNRPCYGISDNGKPHLRIENRVLPSGPTVQDEMANAALWLGCMVQMKEDVGDIRNKMSFEDVYDNFIKAAKFGIDSKFTWMHDQKIPVAELALQELIPRARKGLEMRNIRPEDISRYMDVIECRAKENMNGARWALRSYTKLKKETTEDEALTVLTHAMSVNQKMGLPVHQWKMPELSDLKEYRPSHLKVSEFMNTDLFTVQKDDIVDLVAEMMDWRKIRYTPVEDKEGKLVGLVTLRIVVRHLLKTRNQPENAEGHHTTVKDIMNKHPLTIGPNATLVETMAIMRKNKIGCLPVVQNGELIGIITEMDFLRISGRLLERLEN